ncbi:phytoene/squalene synthase family protein [Lentzea roselyniae]|uniref:Phytoene/squalene synthase family protein n=1 Tax=Lentzea roselyniae TaxID=531940 RepID=A0ABP7CE98_9PSEU
MRVRTNPLDDAGIYEPDIRAAFELCRVLHAAYGGTSYFAAQLLPRAKRCHVDSLYAFALFATRSADNPVAAWSLRDRVCAELDAGTPSDPITRALDHTMRVWGIPVEHVDTFFRSLLMDMTVEGYTTFEELREYVWCSAVLGLQMVPLLEPLSDDAPERVATLAEAFQLTNVVRDLADDLRRGRLYLPSADLAHFGVTRAELEAGVMTPEFQELIKFEIGRVRALYRFAEDGIEAVTPSSRPCLRTAAAWYCSVLDEIEAADYRVLDPRVAARLSRRTMPVASAGSEPFGLRRKAGDPLPGLLVELSA